MTFREKNILKETLMLKSPPADLTLDIFEYNDTKQKFSFFAVRFYQSEFEELSESKKQLYIEWLKERLDSAKKLMTIPTIIEKVE